MAANKPDQEFDSDAYVAPDAVWSYRGYDLKASEFNTAMVHLFRAEVTRANVWRQRLDTTTNWAVLTTAAVLSLAFGEETVHHSIIILNTLLVTLFLYVEARRYRYYELWSLRVRLLETDFFAAMLVPPFRPSEQWAGKMATSLLYPQFPISLWEALGRRLRRNYLWLYVLLGLTWILRVALLPEAVTSWDAFLERAAIGDIPGLAVLLTGLILNAILFVIGIATLYLNDATGEVLPYRAKLTRRENDPTNTPS
ncbi:MAG: hypothetical protein CL610_29100 [Anaerolineaceae bacterium]|nr:hypothetical protein [Anaerolineaceae bacterium]